MLHALIYNSQGYLNKICTRPRQPIFQHGCWRDYNTSSLLEEIHCCLENYSPLEMWLWEDHSYLCRQLHTHVHLVITNYTQKVNNNINMNSLPSSSCDKTLWTRYLLKKKVFHWAYSSRGLESVMVDLQEQLKGQISDNKQEAEYILQESV